MKSIEATALHKQAILHIIYHYKNLKITTMKLNIKGIITSVQAVEEQINHSKGETYKTQNIIVTVPKLTDEFGRTFVQEQNFCVSIFNEKVVMMLSDIESALKTKEYARLRVGISGPGRKDLVEHVLGEFSQNEKDLISIAATLSCNTIEDWILTDESQLVINRCNAQHPN